MQRYVAKTKDAKTGEAGDPGLPPPPPKKKKKINFILVKFNFIKKKTLEKILNI